MKVTLLSIGVLVCSVALGILMFVVKYQVIALENKVDAAYKKLESEERSISLLNAEWAYLNTPSRLKQVAAMLDGVGPLTSDHIIKMSDIPYVTAHIERHR